MFQVRKYLLLPNQEQAQMLSQWEGSTPVEYQVPLIVNCSILVEIRGIRKPVDL